MLWFPVSHSGSWLIFQGKAFSAFHAPGCLPRFSPKQKDFWYKTASVSRFDLSLEWWELIILNFIGINVNTLDCQDKCPDFWNPEILHCFRVPVSWFPYASLHTAYEHFPSVFSKQVVLAANFILHPVSRETFLIASSDNQISSLLNLKKRWGKCVKLSVWNRWCKWHP